MQTETIDRDSIGSRNEQDRVIQHNVKRWQSENAERKRREKAVRERVQFKRQFNRVIVEIAA